MALTQTFHVWLPSRCRYRGAKHRCRYRGAKHRAALNTAAATAAPTLQLRRLQNPANKFARRVVWGFAVH